LAFLGLAYVADMLTEFLDGGPLSQADLDRRDLEAMDSIEAISDQSIIKAWAAYCDKVDNGVALRA
jgi:hypothetical protein